ncbi:542_t:CDS:2 [Acaulospora morrowiae]|uniref:542_t:CDS:1 n=1 Tax=Acaulospora morrowiae TaxID=94023 RepID=A0A9N9G5G3_9GLOM|nr:542_t:CDS:2 [Acaulospora morrowiae]
MSDREYSTKEGAVNDELYEQVVVHGDEEYDPSKDESVSGDTIPSRSTPPSLRPSTIKTRDAEGIYEEDEDSFEKGPSLTEGDNDEVDTSRKLTSLVSASHRTGRTSEAKRQSAEKASALHEQITGSPLEINEEGEVVTGPRISSG